MQSPENYPQGGDAQRPNWPWLVNGAICFAVFALFLFIYICHSVTPVQVLAGVFLLPALAKALIGPLVELAIGRRHGIRMTAVQAGPLCWTREEGRMRFHLSQSIRFRCAVSPPDRPELESPHIAVLHRLSGAISALAGTILCFLAALLARGTPACAAFSIGAILCFLACSCDALPRWADASNSMDNAGADAWTLARNPDARRAYWIRLKVDERLAQGMRLKEMPGEWFAMPDESSLGESLIANLGTLACQRLMDAQQFDRASVQMRQLLSVPSALNDEQRDRMFRDLIVCELLAGHFDAAAQLRRDTRALSGAGKNTLPGLRARYAWAKLGEGSARKSAKLRAKFDRRARWSALPGEAASERALMAVVDARAARD